MPADMTDLAHAVIAVVEGITEDQLDDPTPCEKYTVRDLLLHVHGLSQAFRAAAQKDVGPLTDTPPDGEGGAAELPAGWHAAIVREVGEMAAAWSDDDAWEGMTRAGGVDLPGNVAAAVAFDELTMHGWDLARATGRDFDPGHEALGVVLPFVEASKDDPTRDAIFGPVVDVPDDAPAFDRALGLAGRDPQWRRNAEPERLDA